MTNETNGISLRRLKTFLTNLKNIFAEKKHSHATSDITGLDTALSSKATLAQGDKADSAVQSVKIGTKEYKSGTTVTLPSYPTSLPASDVPSWAKQKTKPTYSASEIGLGNVGNFKAVSTVASQGLTDTEKSNARVNIGAQVAGSYASSTHNHDDKYQAKGSYASASHTHAIANITNLQSALDGKAASNHTHSQYLTSHQDISGKLDNSATGADSLLSKITTSFTAIPTDDTYFIRQDIAGGNTFGRVKFSTLWSYIKGKTDSIYAKVSHKHTKSEITDFPTSMPANGGNASTVNGHTVNADVPSGAKFTDTNTWRPQPDWNATSGDAVIKNKPTIPSVGNGTVTITQNGTSKGTFTMNQSGNTTIALTDNNTTYGTGTASTSGLTKLYTGTGTATDGTMTQAAIKSSLDGKSDSSHTHNQIVNGSYGASVSSDGYVLPVGNSWIGKQGKSWDTAYITNVHGTADSAVKLATARTVSNTEDFVMSFSYDGSANSNANLRYYNSRINVGNTNHYPYHRFAKIDTQTDSYIDKTSTFLITQDYDGGGWGIVRISLRTNNSSSVSTVEAKWLVRCGLNADCVQIGLYNVFGKTYADAFFKTLGTYAGTVIRNLASGARGNIARTWTLIDSAEANNTTTSDKKTSTESYASTSTAATTLHSQAYTSVVVATDGGTVSYAISAGNASKVNNHAVNSDVPTNAKFTDTTYAIATTSANGLMPKDMVTKLNGIANGATAVTSTTVSNWGFKKTDTNTWRGVQNNLTSTDTDQSLSAYQGKVLKDLVDTKTTFTYSSTQPTSPASNAVWVG